MAASKQQPLMMILTLTVTLVWALAAVPSADRDASRSPVILAFGDSLTSGHGIGASRAYPAVLQQRLDEEGLGYRVVNAGVSGDTSVRAVRRLDRALDDDVRIMIVIVLRRRRTAHELPADPCRTRQVRGRRT